MTRAWVDLCSTSLLPTPAGSPPYSTAVIESRVVPKDGGGSRKQLSLLYSRTCFFRARVGSPATCRSNSVMVGIEWSRPSKAFVFTIIR